MPFTKLDNESGVSRTSLTISERCAGYEVLDPLGHRIGDMEEVFVNLDGEPEYIRIRIRHFGAKSVLIPVQFIEEDEKERILTLK